MGNPKYRIRFLDIYIDNLTAKEAQLEIDRLIQTEGSHYVVTPNSDIVVRTQKDLELKHICKTADLILTDGMIPVKISNYLGTPIKERVCMTDFIWDVFDLALEKSYKIFLLGGKEDVLERAVKNIKNRLPELQIADSYSPPFGFEEDAGLLEAVNTRIRNSGADILTVFLGCPKQEKFIYQNKDKYDVPMSITMGGCIDFLAGDVKRAPAWMQGVGLEWFYRFIQEPKRLFKRYFIDDMKIFGMALRQKRKDRGR